MHIVTLKIVLLDRHLFSPVMQTLQSTLCALFIPSCCTPVRHAGIQKNYIVKVKLEFKFLGSDRLIALYFSNFLLT